MPFSHMWLNGIKKIRQTLSRADVICATLSFSGQVGSFFTPKIPSYVKIGHAVSLNFNRIFLHIFVQ